MKNAIIFDLDGTLWDSVPACTASWSRVLAGDPRALGATLTEPQMRSYMGKTELEIAHLMLPGVDDETDHEIMQACTRAEYDYLRSEGGATLFPGVAETVHMLCRSYDLYIVSNCQPGYIELFLDFSRLNDCFAGHTCAGTTGLDKGGSIRLLLDSVGNPSAFYLGDTDGDERATRKAGIPFVHAAYGFGHAMQPDDSISSFSQLPAAAQRLFAKNAR